MNQSRAALAAIATLIPLARSATVYTGRSAIQDRQEQEKITVVASFYLEPPLMVKHLKRKYLWHLKL